MHAWPLPPRETSCTFSDANLGETDREAIQEVNLRAFPRPC